MKKLINQIIRFGFVGFLCFFIDYGIMVLLTEVFKVNYLVSSACSFCISMIINYLLSVFFVFDANKKVNPIRQFITFTGFSVGGLLLNQLIMFVAVEFMGIHYMISKIGATAIVMVYNFITRKIFLEGGKKPEPETEEIDEEA